MALAAAAAAGLGDELEPERLLVTKRELARQVLKCAVSTVNDLMERYEDFPIERRGSIGEAWQFDAAAVVDFLAEKRQAEDAETAAKAEQRKQFSLPIDSVADEESQRLIPSQRAALARARTLEQDLAKRSLFLLEAPETRQVFQNAWARLGRQLAGLPAELARDFGLPEVVCAALRGRIDDFRDQLVTDLQLYLRQDGPEA